MAARRHRRLRWRTPSPVQRSLLDMAAKAAWPYAATRRGAEPTRTNRHEQRCAGARSRWTRSVLPDAAARALAGCAHPSRRRHPLRPCRRQRPASWPYVTGTREAERSLAATDARIVIAGHNAHPRDLRAAAGRRAVGTRRVRALPVTLAKHSLARGPRRGRPAARRRSARRPTRSLTSRKARSRCIASPTTFRPRARRSWRAGLPQRLAHRLAKGV